MFYKSINTEKKKFVSFFRVFEIPAEKLTDRRHRGPDQSEQNAAVLITRSRISTSTICHYLQIMSYSFLINELFERIFVDRRMK